MKHIDLSALAKPFELPCGVVLSNRLVKSAMSDSLGNGCGNPTAQQIRLYERWAHGGAAALIIGEVQSTHKYPEKSGNLVLNKQSNFPQFEQLAAAGSANNTQLWLQLGHAGAMAHSAISQPKGASALNLPGLSCAEMSLEEIQQLPAEFARTAALAQSLGFGGVQIHAAHGFLLSQFLSPLFNQRTDNYGGNIESRSRLLMDVISAVRKVVGPHFVIAVKLNSSDQIIGGLDESDSLRVVSLLDKTCVDLIEISGGTYFPGAKSASDGGDGGVYFLPFANQARQRTSKPLMVTGGFKKPEQALNAINTSSADIIGLARAMVLEPSLPDYWLNNNAYQPNFPQFSSPPEGAITAWYTMKLTHIATDSECRDVHDLTEALALYDARDRGRDTIWLKHFETAPHEWGL